MFNIHVHAVFCLLKTLQWKIFLLVLPFTQIEINRLFLHWFFSYCLGVFYDVFEQYMYMSHCIKLTFLNVKSNWMPFFSIPAVLRFHIIPFWYFFSSRWRPCAWEGRGPVWSLWNCDGAFPGFLHGYSDVTPHRSCPRKTSLHGRRTFHRQGALLSPLSIIGPPLLWSLVWLWAEF